MRFGSPLIQWNDENELPLGMNAPIPFTQDLQGTYAPSNSSKDSIRPLAYLLVAIVAFIVGVIVGSSGEAAGAGSRILWPSSESLKPHPRSIQP
jgi:hypothetical protein